MMTKIGSAALMLAGCAVAPEETTGGETTGEVTQASLCGGGYFDTENAVSNYYLVLEQDYPVEVNVHCKPTGSLCNTNDQEGANQCCKKEVLNKHPLKYISDDDLPYVKGVGCMLSALGDYRCNTFNYGASLLPPYCGVLYGGQSLPVGTSLTSCNGAATLTFKNDGNVVVSDHRGQLWATNTSGRVATAFNMQTDGNLVLYGTGIAWWLALWATNTQNRPGAWMWMQDDCNLVIYDGAMRPLWASNTFCRP